MEYSRCDKLDGEQPTGSPEQGGQALTAVRPAQTSDSEGDDDGQDAVVEMKLEAEPLDCLKFDDNELSAAAN